MTPDDLKPILELVQAHDLAELELEDGTFRLRVKRGGPHVVTHVVPASPVAPVTAPAAPAAPTALAGPPEEGAELAIVKSPIVGTFYRSAEPGASPLASVGDQVKKGQVLCIIEAMKIMNEIESDATGTIRRILCENGQAVEFGQPLFELE